LHDENRKTACHGLPGWQRHCMFLQEYQVGHHLQMKKEVHLTPSLVGAIKKKQKIKKKRL
jgi:hypothetical protein